MSDITRILNSIEDGDPKAAEELLPLVYSKLRELAAVQMGKENPGQTLQPTALVHEAWLRLVDTDSQQHWDHRMHFFAAAAVSMRRILIERARRRKRTIHGGELQRRPLHDEAIIAPMPDEELLSLSSALDRFAQIDPEKARLVELRFFAEMTGDQAAEVLGISSSTADRHWKYARAWLRREMDSEKSGQNF